ncbi:MAG: hypothetical protein HKN26_06170 [Acidimicrobiales bacterium]|nr:hypothetical protein [Acidimicrobiales bacterium]
MVGTNREVSIDKRRPFPFPAEERFWAYSSGEAGAYCLVLVDRERHDDSILSLPMLRTDMPSAQLYRAAVSPDGVEVAFEMLEPGTDVYRYNQHTGELRLSDNDEWRSWRRWSARVRDRSQNR